jgi:hypothetical protein
MLFTTPYVSYRPCSPYAYIFMVWHEERVGLKSLAQYPEPAVRRQLYLTESVGWNLTGSAAPLRSAGKPIQSVQEW